MTLYTSTQLARTSRERLRPPLLLLLLLSCCSSSSSSSVSEDVFYVLAQRCPIAIEFPLLFLLLSSLRCCCCYCCCCCCCCCRPPYHSLRYHRQLCSVPSLPLFTQPLLLRGRVRQQDLLQRDRCMCMCVRLCHPLSPLLLPSRPRLTDAAAILHIHGFVRRQWGNADIMMSVSLRVVREGVHCGRQYCFAAYAEGKTNVAVRREK